MPIKRCVFSRKQKKKGNGKAKVIMGWKFGDSGT